MKKLAISALVFGLLGVSNVASAACENIYVGKLVIYNGEKFFVHGFSSKSGKATILDINAYNNGISMSGSIAHEVRCSSLKEVELGK